LVAAALLNDTKVYSKVISDKVQVEIDLPIEKLSDMILSADGRGYGLFQVDLNMIRPKYGKMTDLEKGAVFVNLYENFLEGKTKRIDYIENIKWVILREKNELVLNLVLGQLNNIYWNFITDVEREQIAPDLERLLYYCMETIAESPSTKKIFFNSFRNITITENNVGRLYDIWSENDAVTVQGLNLSENDKVALAAQLAIRLPDRAEAIVKQQLDSIKNPDTKRRFEFVSPALSSSIEKRDAFFNSLKKIL
jgi:aminopeptidase N